jgi:NADH-quinone oxidoreductase subunit N
MTSALSTIRPELLSLTSEQLGALMPYFIVFGGSILAIIASVLRIISPKWPVFIITLVTAAVAGMESFALMSGGPQVIFNGMMVSDIYSNFFNLIFMGSVGFTALSSFRYLDNEKLQHPEYYVLMLFSAFGMMFMASSLDLIVMFIALEIMSLSVYILVGFRRSDRRSNEAAMKYFILGSVASAVLLYGAALLYGSTGTTDVRQIMALIQKDPSTMTAVFTLGGWLVILGFLFKIASVPFHMWMPDVYEGAPAPITGFMTTGIKAASFAAFVRVFIALGYGKGLTAAIQAHIHDIIWVSAVLTMAIGNLIALSQTNLKRMLAYSSIAHSGYILVGLLAGPGSDQGYAPVVLYLAVYAIMNLGAFVVLTALASREDGGLNLNDLSGLSRRHPWLAFSMAVFLFSMAGIPPTAGFVAKYQLFYAAIQAGEISLVIISVLCSAISVYYYLRVLVHMYMRDPIGAAPAHRISIWSGFAVTAMVVLTLQIGVLPGRMFATVMKAVTSL